MLFNFTKKYSMRKYLPLAALLILPFFADAQPCNCEQKFLFVQKQIETNYSGFRDKVTDKNRAAYNAFTKGYLDRIKKTEKPAYCIVLISEWLKYFKDGHIQAWSQADENDSAAMQQAIKNTEVLTLPQQKIEQLKKAKGIEGIYEHNDGSYTLAVVKSKTAFRDYAGVIVSSKTDLWKPGQVKLEIKEKRDDVYPVLLYMRDHSYRLQYWKFDGAALNDGEWKKTGETAPAAKMKEELKAVSAKKLDDKTLYIQIGTFSDWNAKAIDSVFKANEALLKSMPNLVLDLRGNGGGSDFGFQPILPYIYTDRVIGVGVDVLATPDNIKGWQQLLTNANLPERMKNGIQEVIDSMQKHVGEFVNSADDDTTVMDKVEPYPKKVAVLINGGCGSTTEQFLLVARQSRKVTLMGQHTHGVLDYSNMRRAESPCKDMGLAFATTKSRRIKMGQAIDNVGIKPQVLLTKDKDWVEAAKKYLER
jgi:hypothetical protein